MKNGLEVLRERNSFVMLSYTTISSLFRFRFYNCFACTFELWAQLWLKFQLNQPNEIISNSSAKWFPTTIFGWTNKSNRFIDFPSNFFIHFSFLTFFAIFCHLNFLLRSVGSSRVGASETTVFLLRGWTLTVPAVAVRKCACLREACMIKKILYRGRKRRWP